MYSWCFRLRRGILSYLKLDEGNSRVFLRTPEAVSHIINLEQRHRSRMWCYIDALENTLWISVTAADAPLKLSFSSIISSQNFWKILNPHGLPKCRSRPRNFPSSEFRLRRCTRGRRRETAGGRNSSGNRLSTSHSSPEQHSRWCCTRNLKANQEINAPCNIWTALWKV